MDGITVDEQDRLLGLLLKADDVQGDGEQVIGPGIHPVTVVFDDLARAAAFEELAKAVVYRARGSAPWQDEYEEFVYRCHLCAAEVFGRAFDEAAFRERHPVSRPTVDYLLHVDVLCVVEYCLGLDVPERDRGDERGRFRALERDTRWYAKTPAKTMALMRRLGTLDLAEPEEAAHG
jgi:hypothetical protein